MVRALFIYLTSQAAIINWELEGLSMWNGLEATEVEWIKRKDIIAVEDFGCSGHNHLLN